MVRRTSGLISETDSLPAEGGRLDAVVVVSALAAATAAVFLNVVGELQMSPPASQPVSQLHSLPLRPMQRQRRAFVIDAYACSESRRRLACARATRRASEQSNHQTTDRPSVPTAYQPTIQAKDRAVREPACGAIRRFPEELNAARS